MPLYQQSFYSDQWLEASFEAHTFTAIVEPPTALQNDRLYFAKRSLQKKDLNWRMLEPQLPFIPTLSLKENILMPFSKKQRLKKEQELVHFCQFLQLDERTLRKQASITTAEEVLYAQILANLVHTKQLWLCLNPFHSLTIHQTQHFLEVFHRLVEHYELAIILVTDDEQIVTSKYIDAYFQLEATS